MTFRTTTTAGGQWKVVPTTVSVNGRAVRITLHVRVDKPPPGSRPLKRPYR